MRSEKEIENFKKHLEQVRPNFDWNDFLQAYFTVDDDRYTVIPKDQPASLVDKSDIEAYQVTKEGDIIIFQVTFNYFQRSLDKKYKLTVTDGRLILLN